MQMAQMVFANAVGRATYTMATLLVVGGGPKVRVLSHKKTGENNLLVGTKRIVTLNVDSTGVNYVSRVPSPCY